VQEHRELAGLSINCLDGRLPPLAFRIIHAVVDFQRSRASPRHDHRWP
jgi:hypothetical protein